MSSSVSTYTWQRAGLHFLAWSGGGVVTGAGVVTTGPHTASFLNVQNFLQNYLHFYSALVPVGEGECSRCTQWSLLECAKFLQNYLHLNSALVREEMGRDVAWVSPTVNTMLRFWMCKISCKIIMIWTSYFSSWRRGLAWAGVILNGQKYFF
jgi:hypothetical protein